MKKLFVLLVALFVLTASFAYAEPVFTLADPVATVNMGEQQVYDLTGLEVSVAAGMVGEVTAGRVDLKGDGQQLMGMDVNVLADKVVIAFDGVSTTVYTPNTMPTFDAANLDFDIDFDALMNTLMASVEMDGDTIKIPYTAINDALETLLPEVLKGMEIPGMDASQITDTIAQLKATNSGVNVEATYSETETGLSAKAAVILVNDGVAGDPIFNLNFDVDGDAINFNAEVPYAGSLYFTVAPVGDKYNVSLGGDAQGMGFDLTGVAGIGEADVTFATLDAANAVNIETMTPEENEKITSELMTAGANLINFFSTKIAPAA